MFSRKRVWIFKKSWIIFILVAMFSVFILCLREFSISCASSHYWLESIDIQKLHYSSLASLLRDLLLRFPNSISNCCCIWISTLLFKQQCNSTVLNLKLETFIPKYCKMRSIWLFVLTNFYLSPISIVVWSFFSGILLDFSQASNDSKPALSSFSSTDNSTWKSVV